MKMNREESANALIEFALVIPVFITLLLGVLDYGFALQKYGVISDSARAGVQVALIKGLSTNLSLMKSVAATSAGSANIANLSTVATTVCTCSPGSGTTIPCSGFCPNYGQPAMYAQVTVSGTVPLLFGGSPGVPIKSVARVRIPCPSC